MQKASSWLLAGVLGTSAATSQAATLEERMAAFEARASAAEKRAAAAEQQTQALARELQQIKLATPALQPTASAAPAVAAPTLDTRLAKLEARQQSLEKQDKSGGHLTDGFSFKGYARSGLLINDGLGGGRGGPYTTPAGSVGGAVGRLGNEDDTYMRIDLSKEMYAPNGTRSKFTVSIADGVESSNDWTADESDLNVRQVFTDSIILLRSRATRRLRIPPCGLASDLTEIISISTGWTRTLSIWPVPGVASTMCR